MSFLGRTFFGEDHSLELSIHGNIGEVRANLARNLVEASKGEFRLRIDKQNSIEIYKQGTAFQAVPRFGGVIEERDGQVSIKGSFTTSRFVIVFLTTWFLFFLVPVGRDIILAEVDSDTFGMTLFILAGVLITGLWSFFIARPSAKIIYDCMIGTEQEVGGA